MPYGRGLLRVAQVTRGAAVKLNHLHLTVTDVEATAAFLAKYFGLRDLGGNKGMGFMFDDDGLVLTLMRGKGKISYPGHFHIGFHQESKEAVDELYGRMKADGITGEPPQYSHGYTFYVQAPGGFTVEVLA
jgi:lactoylglutathione lyase